MFVRGLSLVLSRDGLSRTETWPCLDSLCQRLRALGFSSSDVDCASIGLTPLP